MGNSHINNKRIAKNTLFLYLRMVVLMVIGLYTSRVNLSSLGVENYGIYNLVGGIVLILGFLNSSMASAVQRFLNFEMGKGSMEGVKSVFQTSLIIHYIIAGIIFVVAETVGLWFVNTHLVIPTDRVIAANWVYQFSIVTFLVGVISVPYNALIISHEKMSAFAYITIFEAFAKLCVAFLTYISPIDKLVLFSCLLCVTSVSVRIIYQVYCKKNFDESKNIKLRWEKERARKMLSFSSWIVVGGLSNVFHTQGISVVINLFFGVAVNAAQGIANQVNGIVRHFLHNFTVSLNPQLTKSYAAGNLEEMQVLLLRGAKMALIMVSVFAVPIIIQTPTILNIWLEIVPDYTVIFIRILMFITIVDSFSAPLACSKNATGDIKLYQTILTTLSMLHIPLAWLFFAIGKGPEYAMYTYLGITVIMQMVRIFYATKAIGMLLTTFYINVVVKGIISILAAFIVTYLFKLLLPDTVVVDFIICFVSMAVMLVNAFFIILDKKEKEIVVNIINTKILKK